MTRDETIDLIRREYAKGTRRADVASMVGLSADMVSYYASMHGFVHAKVMKYMQPHQVAFIRKNAETMTLADMAEALGVHQSTVRSKIRHLGLTAKGMRPREGAYVVRVKTEAQPAVLADPFEPFVSPTLTAIHGRPMLAKRNAAGVALPYIASLGG